MNGTPKFVYSWKLEPTDKLPAGKRPCLSLRELERQIGHDIEQRLDPTKKKMTVMELVEKYLSTKTGMRPNTMTNYNFVRNLLTKEEFSGRRIGDVRTSDAKLFLIKLQKDGKGHSTIKTVRGVLRPAFQMAVDDDALTKNPFGSVPIGGNQISVRSLDLNRPFAEIADSLDRIAYENFGDTLNRSA